MPTIKKGIARVYGYEEKANKDELNGYPSLDGTGLVPVAEIPDLSAYYLSLGKLIGTVRSQSSNVIVTATDHLLNIAPMAGHLTCTFPATSGFATGQVFVVRRNKSTSGYVIIIQSSASELFNGETVYVLIDIFETIAVINIGGGWVLFPTTGLYFKKSGGAITGSLAMPETGSLFMTGDPSSVIIFNYGAPTGGSIYYNSSAGGLIVYGSNLTLQNDLIGAKTLNQLNQFIGKSDTPSSYVAADKDKFVKVNTGATGLTFSTEKASVQSVSANTTINVGAGIVLANAAGGAFTVTLNDTDYAIAGREITIVKTDSSFNVVTISTTTNKNINGYLNPTLDVQWQTMTLVYDGTKYVIL